MGDFDVRSFRRASGWKKDFRERSALRADAESEWSARQWFKQGRLSAREEAEEEAARLASKAMDRRVKTFWKEDPEKAAFFVQRQEW